VLKTVIPARTRYLRKVNFALSALAFAC